MYQYDAYDHRLVADRVAQRVDVFAELEIQTRQVGKAHGFVSERCRKVNCKRAFNRLCERGTTGPFHCFIPLMAECETHI